MLERFSAMRALPTRATRGVIWLSLGALALGIAIGRPANAQISSGSVSAAPDEKARAKARAHFEEGRAAYKAGQWQKAFDSFLVAWQLIQHKQTAAALGMAEVKLGRYRDGAEHLTYALRQGAELSPEDLKVLEGARSKVGAVIIKASVDGAEILIDGTSVGQSPLPGPVFANVGPVTIEGRRSGYASDKVSIRAEAGRSENVSLKLVEMPTETAAMGKSNQGSGDKFRGTGGARSGLVIAGISLTAVALGGGVVFAVVSAGKGTDAQSIKGLPSECELNPALTSPCGQLKDLRYDQNVFGNASMWSFIAGGALGVGTAVYGLTARRSRFTGSIRVIPLVTAQDGSLVVSGSW